MPRRQRQAHCGGGEGGGGDGGGGQGRGVRRVERGGNGCDGVCLRWNRMDGAGWDVLMGAGAWDLVVIVGGGDAACASSDG